MKSRHWKLPVCVALLACTVALGLPAMASASTITISGTMPLLIFDIQASSITDHTATISWRTNSSATSQVFYDTKLHANVTDYAYHSSLDNAPVMQHSVTLSGLLPSTTYHYRAKSVAVVNGTEFTAISEDYTFTTLPAAHVPPSVITVIGLPLGPRSAILWGWLTDMGTASSVKVYFQWGKTTGYGSETTRQTMRHPGIFFAVITGLTPRTCYHFRAVAVGDGTDYGRDMSFTTWK